MSTLSEIDSEMLTQVTGGISRVASGGKAGGQNLEAMKMALEQLTSVIAELKNRGNDKFQMMFQLLMTLKGGKSDGGGKPEAKAPEGKG